MGQSGLAVRRWVGKLTTAVRLPASALLPLLKVVVSVQCLVFFAPYND